MCDPRVYWARLNATLRTAFVWRNVPIYQLSSVRALIIWAEGPDNFGQSEVAVDFLMIVFQESSDDATTKSRIGLSNGPYRMASTFFYLKTYLFTLTLTFLMLTHKSA